MTDKTVQPLLMRISDQVAGTDVGRLGVLLFGFTKTDIANLPQEDRCYHVRTVIVNFSSLVYSIWQIIMLLFA